MKQNRFFNNCLYFKATVFKEGIKKSVKANKKVIKGSHFKFSETREALAERAGLASMDETL